jgi:hypothetical protein
MKGNSGLGSDKNPPEFRYVFPTTPENDNQTLNSSWDLTYPQIFL